MLQIGTDRVLQGLITQIFLRKKDNQLPKYAIHKILFKLQLELPNDNSVKKRIPFYWYNHGPFSEVIENNITWLKENDILKEYPIQEEKTLLGLEKEIKLPETTDFKEANEILNSISYHVDFYHISSFVDEIYRKYAPCAFMPLFKLDFLKAMEEYVKRVSSGQQTLNLFIDDYSNLDKLESILYDCESELPLVSTFKPFNDSFSSFVTSTGRVFDYIREEGEDTLFSGKEVLSIAEVTWLTFAKGIRILDIGHDKYYNNKLDVWKNQYKQSLISYYNDVDNFNSKALAEIKQDRLPFCTPTERSKNILSSVVEGYLN